MLGRLLLLAALAAPGSAPLAADALPPAVAAKAEAAGIPADAITFVVQRLSGGAPWAAAGADRGVAPASTLKLLTSLVALETFGPAYRGQSRLLVTAEPRDGVLAGDVVLRGEGDVDLDAAALERMLAALRASGVREIRGDLLLDRTWFDPPRTDVGLAPFDEAPEFRYNFIPDALMLGSNLMQVELASDTKTVDARLATPLANVILVPSFTLVERACEEWEDGWKLPAVTTGADGELRVTLSGDFPRSCSASTAINVIDRVAYAERLFRETWARQGGRFTGQVRDGAAPANARSIATHRSRPFSEVLHDINKRSDNPVARVTFLALGKLEGASGTTAERADAVVRGWMAAHGIASAGLVLENGSGLSRRERVTAAQLAAVLRIAASGPWAPEYLASLPVVGVDGPFRTRLRDSAAAGRARIKTGTLRDVSAIAGYVPDARGELQVVVAIINHERADRKVARPILDAMVEWVARTEAPAPGAR